MPMPDGKCADPAHQNARSVRQEWAAAWAQPIIGMLGVVVSSTFIYAGGVFLGVMTETFHWERAQFESAFFIQMLTSLIIGPILGQVVDRYGPRRVALVGCFSSLLASLLLASASGSIGQWRVICVIAGLGAAPLSPIVWITAVAGRFNTSRGLALAVVLAGSGVASTLWPVVTVHYLEWFGWRATFPALAATGFLVILPLTYFFFQGPVPVRRDGGQGPKPRIAPTLLSWTFICILLSGMLFTLLSLGLVRSLVPILTSDGFDLATAANVASLVGVTTLVGRIVTGWALDRLPTKVVGFISFLLPIPAALCLWHGHGSLPLSLAGVAVLGFTTGAESDVLAYVASRRIERSIFASVYAIIIACYTVAAGAGPFVASILYDRGHSYTPFLLAVIPMAMVSALLILMLPAVSSDHADAPV